MAAAKHQRTAAATVAWTSQDFSRLMERVRHNERNAVNAAISLIEQDAGMPFGMLYKSEAARRLRQFAKLDAEQVYRLRARFIDMMLCGYLPREFKEYAKLFRKIGLGDFRYSLETRADQSNRFVRRWCWYLLVHHEGRRPRQPLQPW